MATDVWLADLRVGPKENLLGKLERLARQAGIGQVVHGNDLTAVKVHFGERGGHAFIRPIFLRRIVEVLRSLGAKPFLTDSSTLYPGQRKEAVSALRCGIENGFAYAVVDAPLIMCDGLRGHSARRVPTGSDLLPQADIGLEILEADSLISVNHFKCHELAGFGGAVKNLAMGCSSRTGKLEQHATVGPEVKPDRCTVCGLCLAACAHDAITVEAPHAVIDESLCVGCGRCITVCPEGAIQVRWDQAAPMVMRKMAAYAKGALHGKQGRALHINFVTQVSPKCDCYGHSDSPIVADIGLLASTDPVALDQACCDLVNNARGLADTALKSGHEPGGDKFRGVHPAIDWETTLEEAETLGLGSRPYQLQRLPNIG
jgi:uncharacterized Fe-S center protein